MSGNFSKPNLGFFPIYSASLLLSSPMVSGFLGRGSSGGAGTCLMFSMGSPTDSDGGSLTDSDDSGDGGVSGEGGGGSGG